MISELLHITISTHNFSVFVLTSRARKLVLDFTRSNIQYGLVRIPGGRYVNAAVKIFAAATSSKEEFRFHINQYKEFRDYLTNNYISDNMIDLEAKDVPIGQELNVLIKEMWSTREDQLPVIEYLEQETDYRSKFVDLQTGKGKSYCAMKAIADYNKRTVIIVKAMYIDKWIKDLLKTYEIEPKDIMVIQGSKHLQALIDIGVSGELNAKFIIIGNKTIQNWFKSYELHREETLSLGYNCLPEDFFETIGAGMRLIDEVHQDFHLNFKIDLYTNIERSISLSATLLNNDSFLERMYKLAYPPKERYSGTPLDKYIVAKAVIYGLHKDTRVQTTEYGSVLYSHNAFERSILRNKIIKSNYFKLIWNTIDISFMKDFVEGKKCAVYCSTIDMCTELTAYLKTMYPHLDIRRYVQDDPYENLLESCITVTTILSGGTAHDIPNLKTVVLTIAVDSIQASIQVMGRLRKLPDSRTYFYYLVCKDVPKHLIYHQRRIRLLEERAASFQEINAPFLI